MLGTGHVPRGYIGSVIHATQPGLDEIRITPLDAGELLLFRAVPTDDRDSPEFTRAFRSRLELQLPPRGGTPEHRFRALASGISVRDSGEALVASVRHFRKKGRELGPYAARLRLVGGQGFSTARWGARYHLTVWGDPVKLAQSAVDIFYIDS